ncbi:MAG TPA: filamentous hemagglutinin N-terminal domain-containing protein [Waterburya sp.]|jgi:filamentous hemagglutinin family protein
MKTAVKIALALGISGAIAIDGDRALAQSNIVPDSTLGAENSTLIPNFNGLSVEAIGGGAIRGANLFHSFQEFNVSAGRGAYFLSPSATIQTILARVTGSNPSQILGTLGTTGASSPSLFLINPNGIIFGPNARLDVGSSFTASTASAVTFGNGIEFSASNPQAPPLLSINVPLGLQYGRNPGSISVQRSELVVPNGQTLALVGGDVSLDGAFLGAVGGRIELGAVAGTGTVALNGNGSNLSLSFPQGVAFTDLSLTNNARVFVMAGGGGSIAINAQNFSLAGGSGLYAGIPSGSSSGNAIAGNIDINATGATTLTDESLISNAVLQGARGQGGDINIETGQLLVRDGALVSAANFGEGDGGNLTINASQSVQIIGGSTNGQFTSGLFTGTAQGSSGNGGDLTINTGSLLVRDGALISTGTFGRGDGGNLTVNASQDVQLIGTSADGLLGSGLSTQTNQGSSGKGGDLTINTGSLLVRDGAGANAFTFGTGDGGNLTVNASQDVQLIGISTAGRSSTLSTQANLGSSGKAGDLTINTTNLLVQDGALISTFTLSKGDGGNLTVNASQQVQAFGTSADGRRGSSLLTESSSNASGKAGDLTINTSSLLIQDGARVSASTFGTGDGGNLTVNASQQVQAVGTSADGRSSSRLTSEAYGAGAAGNLSITTGRFIATGGAYASTSTVDAGRGGELTVTASELVELIGTTSNKIPTGLYTGTEGGTGDSGSLTVNTPALLVRDGAVISASTFGRGKGGNLTVNASQSVQVIGTSADREFFSGLFAQASSDSSGKAGDITINTSSLLVQDGAQVSTSSFGAGNGGNLTVNASQRVQLIGELAGQFGSGLISEAFGTGAAGNVSINTGRFIATGGAYASTYTYGAGQGGTLTVDASEFVELIGNGRFSSGIYTGTQGTGNSGNLTVSTPVLLVRDGAVVYASTVGAGNGGRLTVNAPQQVQVIGISPDGQFSSALFASAAQGSSGKAGDVTVNTGSLIVRDGAVVSARTAGSGNGGSLTIKASEQVQLSGAGSGLLVNATAGSTAGNLTVETKQMSVRDGAQVTVSSPSGQAGNMTIQANSLLLNRGTLSAETGKSSPQGGANITLNGLDLLRMDNESLISANAFNEANGGNVTINSTFIVATPPTGPNGSDITANAGQGNGGAVNVTTQGLYGIEFRPKLTPKNDITVSSDFGLTGTFQLNTPGVDPTRGLTNLPSETIDASKQIVQNCRASRTAARVENKFVIVGRGGLPPSPNDMLQGDSGVTPWVTLDSETQKNSNTTRATVTPSRPLPKQMVEAQGWVVNEKGQIVLTASAPTVTLQDEWFDPAHCSTLPSTEKLQS